MRTPVIELEDIAIAFGDKQVLDGVDLTIYAGETMVVIGRSGSGKTVLLKIMMGLLKPDRGHVRLFGRDLATVSAQELVELHKRTGMLFQNYALFDALSVEQNVEFPLVEGHHARRRDAARTSHELLRLLGLTESENVLPGELSGGMRKRVGLARALVSHPELAIFDEPTTGLDPLMIEQVDEVIATAKQQYGITAVVVSHDLVTVQHLADRVAFLHEGRIILCGPYDELLASRLPPVRAFLAGASPMHAATEARPAQQPVIEMIDVHKSFADNHVLRGVNLAIYPGRITALIGASGSGKSVLTKHIMGMLTPDRGQVLVLGRDLASMKERELEELRTHFGLVFQHAALLDWLTVEENVAFPLVEGRHASRRKSRPVVAETLERLGLTPLRHRLPGELSAGERKRVAVGRALVARPEILIYDEPTTGQDPTRAHEIGDLIVQTHEQFDITSIVISHDMPSTFRIAHTIAMLADGRILAIGTPAELAASPDAYVHHFLDAGGITCDTVAATSFGSI